MEVAKVEAGISHRALASVLSITRFARDSNTKAISMVRITCINKDNGDHEDPYLAIEFFGWINEETGERGKSTRMDMVRFIEGGNTAFVRGTSGVVAWLVVRTSVRGNKFVKTIADDRETNNLLFLPECV